MIRFKNNKFIHHCWTFAYYYYISRTSNGMLSIKLPNARSKVIPIETLRSSTYISLMAIPNDNINIEILCDNPLDCIMFPDEDLL